MAGGNSSNGTSGEMVTTSTRAHMTAGRKISESDEPTTKPAETAEMGHISEGKPLILLQVNCRSICNKILEFWKFN